jgi:hypothetical protein
MHTMNHLERLAIRYLRRHAIKRQIGCPHCGRPITTTSTWAEIKGDIWHGDCIIEKHKPPLPEPTWPDIGKH